jgi:hypothetical protein
LKTRVLLFFKFAVCLAVVGLFVFCFVPVGFAVSSDEAGTALKRAEADLGSAFAAVAEAERAGANVTLLLTRLNVADGFLSEGYAAFRSGNYDSASSSAAACSGSIEGVLDDAGLLRSSAERAQNDRVLLTAVTTGVGLVMLFALGFLGWGFLKKWFSSRVLGLRPLVEESE